jgi:hypothetical protein
MAILIAEFSRKEYKIVGPRFLEKDWYYLQAQTDMPFHYLKLVLSIFTRFLLPRSFFSFELRGSYFKTSSVRY